MTSAAPSVASTAQVMDADRKRARDGLLGGVGSASAIQYPLWECSGVGLLALERGEGFAVVVVVAMAGDES